jgi:hypothetical protein
MNGSKAICAIVYLSRHLRRYVGESFVEVFEGFATVEARRGASWRMLLSEFYHLCGSKDGEEERRKHSRVYYSR